MTLYCISGLGADKRMFQRIAFHQSIKVVHLDWLEPDGNETLQAYCLRFSKLVDTSEPFSLLGLSFGGVIAIELTGYLDPLHIILLSSVASRHELPLKYRLAGLLRLHRLVPVKVFKAPTRATFWYFSARNSQEKRLLTNILQGTSTQFLKWAVDKVLTWQRSDRRTNLFHIHGTEDRIIPYSGTNADQPVQGAGHLMVFTHAEQISKHVNQKLGFS